jgi:hypothetical protein
MTDNARATLNPTRPDRTAFSRFIAHIGVLSAAMLISILILGEQTSFPMVWSDEQLSDWPAPVAGLNARPGFFKQRKYYAVKGDNYRTYPVYHPDRETPGY